MAGPLASLLIPARITLAVQSTEHAAAIHEVVRLLDGNPEVTDFQGFLGELLARESVDTTCLGNGIAIPHARTEHVSGIVMAVGRSNAGIYFENGNETIRLIFAMGTPRANAGGYLQVVGVLCRIIKDPANCEALLSASTAEDFMQTLLDLEARVLAAPRASTSRC
jgi:mannitol/fructose-specific phosphotransferase system IIA component (Ntr-type)